MALDSVFLHPLAIPAALTTTPGASCAMANPVRMLRHCGSEKSILMLMVTASRFSALPASCAACSLCAPRKSSAFQKGGNRTSRACRWCCVASCCCFLGAALRACRRLGWVLDCCLHHDQGILRGRNLCRQDAHHLRSVSRLLGFRVGPHICFARAGLRSQVGPAVMAWAH